MTPAVPAAASLAGPPDAPLPADGAGGPTPPARRQPAAAATAHLPVSVGRFLTTIRNGAALRGPPQ
eukprot:9946584-Alexandrium_andersonii.AAC.1